jgi:hypothetical protein
MLLPLAQTLADSQSNWAAAWQVIFDLAAVLGFLLILLIIVGALSMLPDFFRYLKLSNM